MDRDIGEIVARADFFAERMGTLIAEAAVAADFRQVAQLVHRGLDEETAGQAVPSPVACEPGCSACCIVNVSVLVPEAIAIADYLQWSLPPALLGSIRERIHRQAERVRWVEDVERPRLQLRCALLNDEGRCLVHPVRPLLCRSVSSVDRQACESLPSQGVAVVVMDLHQKILCNLIFTALARILQDKGMDCRSLELARMVGNILDRPSLVDEFRSGRRGEFF